MNATYIIAICFLLGFTQVKAQQPANKIQYFGAVQTGLITGSSDVDLSAQVLNGFRYKSWKVAAGAGYDGYGIPAVPITLYVQKDFTKLKHKPFVYGQSGYSIALKVNDWHMKSFDDRDMYLLNNGFVAEAGIGYQWKVGKKIHLMLNTGFSFKKHKVYEMYVPYYYWLSSAPVTNFEPSYNTLDYYYRRIVCRFGIHF